MSDQSVQSRFFPHFVVCPSCEYELGTEYLDTCPECGNPLDTYYESGRIINIEPHHLDTFPKDHNPRPDRYLDGILKHSRLELLLATLISAFGVFSIFGLGYGLKQQPPTHLNYWAIGAFCVFTGAPITLVGVVIYAEIRAILKRSQLKKGLLTNKVEQHDLKIFRALILEHINSQWLLLRTDWPGRNAILIIPPNELERLQIDTDAPIGSNAMIDRIPNSTAIVGFNTYGDPVPSRISKQIKPRLLARFIRTIHAYEYEHNILPKRKMGSYFTSDC